MATARAHITIRGLDEVSKALKRMDKPAAVRLVRKGFRRALIPVRDATAAAAPKRTGALAADVKILSGRTRKGILAMRVVIGKGSYKGDRFYGGFQEFGWRLGSRKRGPDRPKIEGKWFMHGAFLKEGPGAKANAEKYLWEEIQKVMKI
jgi:hypothetical protein